MSRERAVSAIKRGALSELHHVLEKSEWDVGSEPLDSKGQTALHIACANGHLDIVQYLVTMKECSVTVENLPGHVCIHTPLMLSFVNKHWKITNFLLQIAHNSAFMLKELIITIYSESFRMELAKEALVTSCKEGNFELVKYLTKIGWPTADYRETTQLARQSDNLQIVKYLLTHCQCTMPDDMSEMHIACIQGVAEKVKIALESNRSSVLGTADHYGTTPIHYATLEPNLLRMIVQYAGKMLLNINNNVGNTPLHHSIKYECIESVTALVEARGCDVNIANVKGETPLIAACKYSNSAIVQLLVASERCDINTSDCEGNTALHIAVRIYSNSQLENVQCLLQSDRCNPNVINKSGFTPLHIVCHQGSIPLLEALVANKRCDLNIQDGNGDTALHIGVENVEVVKCLLESGRARCDIYNEKGLTQFHNAIAYGVMGSVEVMMKNGVNILQTTNDMFQNSPIYIACIYCRIDILKFFLGFKSCDPNQQNAVGNTALHIVCRMRTGSELQFLEVLTSTPGINPTLVNHEGIAPFKVVMDNSDTILHIACAEGHPAMVEYLVKNGGDVLKPDRCGNAPIHIASMYFKLQILKVLLDFKSCDPNQQNVNGDTALHIVCNTIHNARRLQFLVLQCLLQNDRCNPNVINKSDQTPLHIVCHRDDIPLFEALVADKRCDLNIQDGKGDTALHIGVENVEVVKCLLESGRSRCDIYNEEGLTPFHKAIANGNTSSVEVMLKSGVNILQTSNDDSPIHIACKHSRVDTLKVLLAYTNCDPNQKNAEGDTALHIVCRMRTGREPEVLKVLASTPGINPTLLNHEGDAPIHTACACMNSMSLESLKVLLSCENCDLNQQNSRGDTALHIMCRKRNQLQLVQVLTSTPGINPSLVNHEGISPTEIVDSDGNTLLHNACAKGYTSMVELLVKNGADVLKLNRHGDAPIHIACQHSKLDILKLLLESGHCDPNQQNGNGDMPLHIACRMSSGSKLPFLKMLLSTPGIKPEIVNHEGCTPIEVAGTNYFAIDAIKKFLEHKKSSIQAYLKIFVVGNSGNGKSTLIKAVTTEASQLRKYAPLSKMKYVNPSDVPPHTAGIVPIPFNSKHFGNAVLYDFAGQYEYYSSHAAVMENLILPSPPLFLLLIDISKSKEVIREELVYWWHFINNQSQKAVAPPHVILAGSHKDMVKSSVREEMETMIRECIKCIAVTFHFVGYFPLDCRKLVSPDLSALLTKLNSTCQTLRQIVDANLHCHILNALLRAPEFQDAGYCEAIHIMNRIESDDALLPKNVSQLIPLLASLNDQGHILLLQNHTDKSKSWVILKPDVLLAEVNGSVFAPKGFKEHFQFAMSTGVVPFSKLKEKFTEYNHEVLVEYLTHLEFCFRIKDQHTLDMITNNEVYESAATEEYYFFPALVCVENPTNVCPLHQSVDYECGWLYKCSKETEQLTTRFLHVLILRLAFACEPPDDPTETESVVLLRSCSVWKHGIAWWTNDGIEVIVEVGLQCRWVAVMMRCPATERVQCAELRSKVISTVLKTKTDFCPAIAMKEYLIAPLSLKYPFEGRELILYSMSEVAKVTINGKKFAKDTKGDNLISLPQLLPFEPYKNMGDLIWKFFTGDPSAAVTPEELTQLAEKYYDKLAELKTAFKPDISSFQRECVKADCTEVERCVALFHILQRRGRFKTWRDFQQEFSRFSIFCERSPLEHIQKDKDRTLGDDTVTSDSVRASEDVPQSLSSPVPKSPIQLPSHHMPHTFIDVASAEGAAKETVAESEKGSYAHSTLVESTHMSEDNTAYQAITRLTPTMIHLENKVIPTVCPLWREIGCQLHLKTYVLDEIDADCRGVRRCCTRMFEEWLKEDTEASWYAVWSACKKVKENLASGPNEPHTKESIESLDQLISTLPDFFTTL